MGLSKTALDASSTSHRSLDLGSLGALEWYMGVRYNLRNHHVGLLNGRSLDGTATLTLSHSPHDGVAFGTLNRYW